LYIETPGKENMEKIGLFDVKILVSGIKNNGRIDDQALGASEAGTGRVLDGLASLIERGLIRLNGDKSFQVTDAARQILWNEGIPLRVRVLRILEASPLNLGEISEYLDEQEGKVGAEIEDLRKNRLVLMSASRAGGGLERVFEILPEGKDELERISSQGRGYSDPRQGKTPDAEVRGLLGEISESLEDSGMDEETRRGVLEKISKIRSKLDA